MIRKRTGIKARALMATYSSIMLYRTIRDLFRRIQCLPSEPITLDPKEVKIWMVGHATVFINFFGTTILTDPVLVAGLPFPKRLVRHGYKAEELPPLDLIIISHAHFDHFNKRTLRKLATKTRTIVVPRQCADVIQDLPFHKIVELDWHKNFSADGATISAYRPQHWGKRVPWEKRNRGYNCYTIEKNGRTIFFGGDTAYGPFFKDIGQKHNIDIALLPISAYKPALLGPHHMDPNEAHEAFADLRSTHCIPIHWGSFRLAMEAMEEPPTLFYLRAQREGLTERTHILHNGASFSLGDSHNLEMPELVPELITEQNRNSA